MVTNLVANDGKPQGHISYKDNPLTYLLKCGIGGRSRTALICCITSAEDSMEETIQTLRFALQVRRGCSPVFLAVLGRVCCVLPSVFFSVAGCAPLPSAAAPWAFSGAGV